MSQLQLFKIPLYSGDVVYTPDWVAKDNGSVFNYAWKVGWIKHIRHYGAGHELGFKMGNPVGAVYFIKGYRGDTSWSRYSHKGKLKEEQNKEG